MEASEDSKHGACLPSFLIFKAGVFLGFSAYLLSQIVTLQQDYNSDVPDFVKSIVDIVKQLMSYTTNVDVDSILQGIYIFLSVIVACSSLEILGAIFSLCYSMCPCHQLETQQVYHIVWVIISLLQIPSFVLLTLFAFIIAICGFVWMGVGTIVGGGVGTAMLLLFGVALPLLIIGCIGCCGSCGRARRANPRHYQRLSDRTGVVVYHHSSNVRFVQDEQRGLSSKRPLENTPQNQRRGPPKGTGEDAYNLGASPGVVCVGCGADCPAAASFCGACGKSVIKD